MASQLDVLDLPERRRLAALARQSAATVEDRGMLSLAELLRKLARQAERDHRTIANLLNEALGGREE